MLGGKQVARSPGDSGTFGIVAAVCVWFVWTRAEARNGTSRVWCGWRVRVQRRWRREREATAMSMWSETCRTYYSVQKREAFSAPSGSADTV